MVGRTMPVLGMVDSKMAGSAISLLLLISLSMATPIPVLDTYPLTKVVNLILTNVKQTLSFSILFSLSRSCTVYTVQPF
jgi:hypothetical protein